METLATFLAWASGFALMGYHGGPVNTLATSLAIDASLAPLTATIAFRRGRPAWLWALLGFAFGMWALAAILLVRRADAESDRPPSQPFQPPSNAA